MSDSFPTMPVELLSLILELSVTHFYHSTTYAGRQRTLRNLCLASKQFRQIARPLLYEIVKVKSQKAFKKVFGILGGSKETGLSVKILVCQSWTQASNRQWLDTSAIDKVVSLCPQLSSLNVQVVDNWNLSLDPLSRLRHLSNLHLSGVSLSLTVPMPSLRSLTLVGSAASSSSISHLSPAILPSLRYFAFGNNDAGLEYLARMGSPDYLRVLAQLEAWSIDFAVLRDLHRLGLLEEYFRPVLPCTLVDVSLNDSDLGRHSLAVLTTAHHLRLLCFSVRKESRENLSWITKMVNTYCPLVPLRSIYLSSTRRRFPAVTKEFEGALDELEQACRERGVEIIPEQQPQSSSFDSAVSEEFWRRMKGRKEELSQPRGN